MKFLSGNFSFEEFGAKNPNNLKIDLTLDNIIGDMKCLVEAFTMNNNSDIIKDHKSIYDFLVPEIPLSSNYSSRKSKSALDPKICKKDFLCSPLALRKEFEKSNETFYLAEKSELITKILCDSVFVKNVKRQLYDINEDLSRIFNNDTCLKGLESARRRSRILKEQLGLDFDIHEFINITDTRELQLSKNIKNKILNATEEAVCGYLDKLDKNWQKTQRKLIPKIKLPTNMTKEDTEKLLNNFEYINELRYKLTGSSDIDFTYIHRVNKLKEKLIAEKPFRRKMINKKICDSREMQVLSKAIKAIRGIQYKEANSFLCAVLTSSSDVLVELKGAVDASSDTVAVREFSTLENFILSKKCFG